MQAMEPFFSVLLSWIFLGEAASAPVLLSLLPIVGGVAAASVSEVGLRVWISCDLATGSVVWQPNVVRLSKYPAGI